MKCQAAETLKQQIPLLDYVGREAGEQCPERERLLGEWTQCGRRLAKLLDDHLATMKRRAPSLAGFEEQIRLARAAEPEASANTSAM